MHSSSFLKEQGTRHPPPFVQPATSARGIVPRLRGQHRLQRMSRGRLRTRRLRIASCRLARRHVAPELLAVDDEAEHDLVDAIHALRSAETTYRLACDDRAVACFQRDGVLADLLGRDGDGTAAELEVNVAYARVSSARWV
jgi:hypothetical protein